MTFLVDPTVVSQMSGTLGVSGEDIDHVRRYLSKWSNFQANGALLEKFMEPHREAMAVLKARMLQIEEVVSASAAAIKGTVAYYERTDANAAATFDHTLPQAQRPGDDDNHLYRMKHPPANTDKATNLADPVDVSDHLKAPSADVSGGFPYELISLASDVFSPMMWLDKIIDDLTGKSPVHKAVKMYSGDWEGFAQCADAFDRINKALNAVGVNIQFRNEAIGHGWTGNAADAAYAYFHRLANGIADHRWRFQELREIYTNAAHVAYHNGQQAKGVLTAIADSLAVAGLLAVGGFLLGGPYAALGVSAIMAGRIATQVLNVTGYLSAAMLAIDTAAASVATLVAKLEDHSGANFRVPLPPAYDSPVA